MVELELEPRVFFKIERKSREYRESQAGGEDVKMNVERYRVFKRERKRDLD